MKATKAQRNSGNFLINEQGHIIGIKGPKVTDPDLIREVQSSPRKTPKRKGSP